MTPAESKPPQQAQDEYSGAPQRRTTQAQWTLTQQALEKLLAALSSDREAAARQYVSLRTKLVRYFEKHSIDAAEDRADDAVNRVARRIEEGKQVDNVIAYAYRVAYLVFLEALKEPEQTELDPEKALSIAYQPALEDTELEPRQRCFDSCLGNLSTENRELILGYYQEDGRAKIELRKQWAAKLRISLDALRIRAHRIRKSLEECISNCLGQTA